MLLNSKSIYEWLKYVLAKSATWPGLKCACFPVESNISDLGNAFELRTVTDF